MLFVVSRGLGCAVRGVHVKADITTSSSSKIAVSLRWLWLTCVCTLRRLLLGVTERDMFQHSVAFESSDSSDLESSQIARFRAESRSVYSGVVIFKKMF